MSPGPGSGPGGEGQPRRRGSTPSERRARRAAIEDAAVVLDAAAAFLAVRPRSVAETRRRLGRLGYREALVEEAVGRLLALGYLDDEGFGRAWLESRDRARPRGELALRRELRLKGLAPERIAALLEERAGRVDSGPEAPTSVDLAAARRLLEGRAAMLQREPDPLRRRQRAYALLARNGFDPDICREAVGELA